MKVVLELFLLGMAMMVSTESFGQSPEEIMIGAYEKSKRVKGGFYEMTRKMKYMSDADTNSNTYKCHFHKLPKDKVFGFAFYQPYADSTGALALQLMYNGEALIRVNHKDSTAVITSTDKWAHLLDKEDYDFFDPLVSSSNEAILHSFKPKKKYEVELIGVDILHSILCHHIRIIDFEKFNKNEPIQKLREEFSYWISMEDSLVRKYSRAIDLILNGDTMYQYEELTLDNVQLNQASGNITPGINAIPGYITLKEYTPYEREPLLQVSTQAPSWSLYSLSGDSVRLDDLKGKLVLIDFFYKSCYPCMQALPVLESLHERYIEKGLSVIGIDPFDKDAEDLRKFLSKRGITYTILLSDKAFPKKYKVSSYPTMYLLDENGNVLHSQIGYGEGTEKKLEKIIEQHLN